MPCDRMLSIDVFGHKLVFFWLEESGRSSRGSHQCMMSVKEACQLNYVIVNELTKFMPKYVDDRQLLHTCMHARIISVVVSYGAYILFWWLDLFASCSPAVQTLVEAASTAMFTLRPPQQL